MKKRIYIWSSVLAVLALFWLGGKALQAHKNLVTLDVRDADVRDVLKKIQWQTWETIVVHKDVKGKVSFNVVKVPLEEVLGIITEQTSVRISAVYPIYSKSSAYVNLRKIARGDAYKNTVGWTNFNMAGNGGGRGGFGGGRGGPGGGGPGGFGGGLMAQDSPVTLNLAAKDLNFATLALARHASAQVITEDGARGGLISLKLDEVPFLTAVEKVAKASGLKAEVFYSVQAADQDRFAGFGGFGDDEGGGGGRRGGGGTNNFGGRGRFGGEGNTNWQASLEVRNDDREMARQREVEARLATMTPEEQAKAKEQQEKFEDIRNLPEDQRRQAFEAMRNDPAMQARGENRRTSYLNNSSPEQRADRSREAMDRRARRQQGGQNGGRGGR